MTANHFRFIERRSTVVFKSFSVPLELVNLTAGRVLLKIGRIVTPLECHVGVTQTHFIACRNQVKARPAHIRIWRLPSGKSRADNSTPILFRCLVFWCDKPHFSRRVFCLTRNSINVRFGLGTQPWYPNFRA